MFVVITESQPDLNLAGLASKFPQILAAHGDRDVLRYIRSSQSDNGCPVPVYRDTYLVFAGLGIGPHVLEPFDGGQGACDFRAEFVQQFRRISRDLDRETFTAALLVELEGRLADGNRRHVCLDSLYDLPRRQCRVLLLG